VNEEGEYFLFKADPAALEIVAKNKVADQVYATPSIAGKEIFLRVAFFDGERRSERLICFGE